MSSQFQHLTLHDQDRIDELLQTFPMRDIHHEPRYVRLFQEYTTQEARYFYFQKGRIHVMAAFFERALPSKTSVASKDLVSPWYYGGPLYVFDDATEFEDAFQEYLSRLDSYCKENHIVSEFQRCNPTLENHQPYRGDAGLSFNRKVVAIDLQKSMEIIRGEYEHKARKNIKRAHESGLRTVRSADPAAIETFERLYARAMERKKAGQFYFFNERFFRHLFEIFPEEAQLFTVYKGPDAIASSIVLGNHVILHDYLRAADPEFLALRPNDLLVDEISAWARGAGYREYVLGGGNSNSQDDTLFKFKASFSPLTRDFYLYKKIHDREAYEARCLSEGKSSGELKYEQANYFPEYATS
ncbi:MAG TPA: GNAT family N-acetyltransferase [Candidatus Paceibacterota bacterium]|nr:GNAT family N-acetyltransferase [Candidatus Paceibacterota bacterium]